MSQKPRKPGMQAKSKQQDDNDNLIVFDVRTLARFREDW